MGDKKTKHKSLESWIWDAACSIRGAKDAPNYKDYILPLIFTKRLGLDDVEADIISKSYEHLIRKFAEGGGQRIADTLIGWKEEETAWRDGVVSQTEGRWRDFRVAKVPPKPHR